MSDLLRCGRIKDPFYRDNEKEALQMASYDYEYKRNLRRQRGKVRDHSKARFL
ncbi:glycosyl hydrolase 2 galactose-binding domain-containing protein [Marinithermofilum abyssi]